MFNCKKNLLVVSYSLHMTIYRRRDKVRKTRSESMVVETTRKCRERIFKIRIGGSNEEDVMSVFRASRDEIRERAQSLIIGLADHGN